MWHRWYWYVVTNASEELAASVFEGRWFLLNLASMYQASRCHIPEDYVVITQYWRGLTTCVWVNVESTENNCSSPSSKKKEKLLQNIVLFRCIWSFLVLCWVVGLFVCYRCLSVTNTVCQSISSTRGDLTVSGRDLPTGPPPVPVENRWQTFFHRLKYHPYNSLAYSYFIDDSISNCHGAC
jgi:hypothetical protein